jgi:flavin-dependent dehydrogenase
MLEKAHHPRFHIGESLLPANLPLLEALGVREQVEAIGMPKWGVDFTSPDHGRSCELQFGEAWDKSMPKALQVRRSQFDEILFRQAAKEGAKTVEGCKVRGVSFDDAGATVEAQHDDGSRSLWRARFVIDATGRDTLLAQQFESKSRNPKHNSAALYGHFRGARRLDGPRAGNISIFWFKHGWFWFIPLADGATSVGAVTWPRYLKTRDKPLKDFFADTIALSPELSARLAGASLIDDAVHATGNYTYACRKTSGKRHLMLGDAYAFLDPVFSSGVYLAMVGAFEAAQTVATCLDHPKNAEAALRRFERLMQKGPREFSWFIYRMTSPALRDLFMNPGNLLRMQEAVLSLLAGDIFGKTPIWRSLRLFKLAYYVRSAMILPRAWAAWRRRQHQLRDTAAGQGDRGMTLSS